LTFPAELATMQAAQESHMFDACQVGSIVSAQDAIGDLVAGTASYGAEQACGLLMQSGTTSARAEFRTQDGTIVQADAKLRLAHDAAVSVTSVVKVTKRFGTTLAVPLVYDVIGVPATGSTGTVCYLRQVTT
jgi:hypothetical protein